MRRINPLLSIASRQSRWRLLKLQQRPRNILPAVLISSQQQQQQQYRRSYSKTLSFSSSSSTSSAESSSSSASLSSSKVLCWLKDVLRTKSLNPTNPILDSLPSPDDVAEYSLRSVVLEEENDASLDLHFALAQLPNFSVWEPHHVTTLITTIAHRYGTELQQLEGTLLKKTMQDSSSTTTPPSPARAQTALVLLLLELDRLNAPVVHVEKITELFTTLASPPDQIDDWSIAAEQVATVAAVAAANTTAVGTLATQTMDQQLYQSPVVYYALVQALVASSSSLSSAEIAVSAYLIPYWKRGTHLDDENTNNNNNFDDDVTDPSNSIQTELMVLNDRLARVPNYEHASKAMRLQCMSDMYNCIGLSRMQAQAILETTTTSRVGQHPTNRNKADPTTTNDVVWELARLQHNHMVRKPQQELLVTLYPQISKFVQPFLPTQTKIDLGDVGAFLQNKATKTTMGDSDGSHGTITAAQQHALMVARYGFKQHMNFNGVLQGILDFCDTVLGLEIVQEQHRDHNSHSNKGWNKNVRLLHVYQKQPTETKTETETEKTDNDNNRDTTGTNVNTGNTAGGSIYLGTIYFDPFADSYWRTEDAKDVVLSKLFTSSKCITNQTIAPIVIMALNIKPIWDDTPVPMTFHNTRQLLYQFGKAIQLVLEQTNQKRNYYDDTNHFDEEEAAEDTVASATNHENNNDENNSTEPKQQQTKLPEPPPIDTSEFMAHFMEMWIQNDGFLNRLSQLSSSSSGNDDNDNDNDDDGDMSSVLLLDEASIQVLRDDIKREKALDYINTMFLSVLQFEVYDKFDPRGDETLVGLQERIATSYLPSTNRPDPSDLSPLVAVFQQSGMNQQMSSYATLYSEVLGATLYEKIQNAIVVHRDSTEVTRIGTGIRDLFLKNTTMVTTRKSEKTGSITTKTNSFRSDFEKLVASCSGGKSDDNSSTTNVISGEPLKRVYQFDKVEEK